jgi:hypothetical protein
LYAFGAQLASVDNSGGVAEIVDRQTTNELEWSRDLEPSCRVRLGLGKELAKPPHDDRSAWDTPARLVFNASHYLGGDT